MPFASLLAGFVPVVLLLAALRFLDSYKLVPRRMLLESVVAGALAAGFAYIAYSLLLDVAHVDRVILDRAIAPLIEEVLKAAFVAWLLRTAQVGFMVDAAICGFAVGTGFGIVENLYYAGALRDLSLPLWLARGLGTAVMHGSTTAMFAIVSMGLSERHGGGARLHLLVPGLLLAYTVHALFNQLHLNPLIRASVLIATLPLLLLAVFERSERATRDWLGSGLDGDVEVLEQILDGEVVGTRVGNYLESLKTRFPGAVVGDMLCLLRIHLELSLRAKGMLIARSAGVIVEPDASLHAALAELRFLERAVGPIGCLAMLPLRRTSSRDLWQILMLSRHAERRGSGRER